MTTVTRFTRDIQW